MVVAEAASEVLLDGHLSVHDVALEGSDVDGDELERLARTQHQLEALGAGHHLRAVGVTIRPRRAHGKGAKHVGVAGARLVVFHLGAVLRLPVRFGRHVPAVTAVVEAQEEFGDVVAVVVHCRLGQGAARALPLALHDVVQVVRLVCHVELQHRGALDEERAVLIQIADDGLVSQAAAVVVEFEAESDGDVLPSQADGQSLANHAVGQRGRERDVLHVARLQFPCRISRPQGQRLRVHLLMQGELAHEVLKQSAVRAGYLRVGLLAEELGQRDAFTRAVAEVEPHAVVLQSPGHGLGRAVGRHLCRHRFCQGGEKGEQSRQEDKAVSFHRSYQGMTEIFMDEMFSPACQCRMYSPGTEGSCRR